MNPRYDTHREGSALLRAGDFRTAVSVLEKGLATHGSHVGLRSDLAFAAYLAGDMGCFRLFVEGLEKEFRACEPQLNEKSRLLTLISLAKFAEELGRVADASDYIDRALTLLGTGHPQEFHVRCQKLRLLASFGRTDELGSLYRDLLFVSEKNAHHLIETFHALMLAEARLLGGDAAWARFALLSQRSDLRAADLRMAAFDLLEIALEQADEKGAARALAFQATHCAGALDAFEQELLRFALGPPALREEDFLRYTRALSPMGQMRILALAAARPAEHQASAQTRLHMQLASFDFRTRSYLRRKWRASFAAEETRTVYVAEAAGCISCGEAKLRFGARANPWAILRALALRSAYPPEELLSLLGRRDSASEQESLRIAVLRLNKKLVSLTGLGWVIRSTKRKVELNPGVRLRIED